MSPARGSVADILVTNHNRPLSFDDGSGFQTYTPTSGFDSTAAQQQSGMRETNRDILGVISDDRFTYDQLRAGLWEGATVSVSKVDWMYPHAGAIETKRYHIGRITQTGIEFTAELSGLTNRLQAKSGRVTRRNCDADLFDGRCGISATGAAADIDVDWETTGVPVAAGTQDPTEPRRIFGVALANIPTGLAADFYDYGKAIWTTGENATIGHVSIIKAFTDGSPNHTFEFYEPTPFDIADNDNFTALVGCDKLIATCATKFVATNFPAPEGNTINFRAQHLMPGSDHVLRTPTTTN